VSLNFAQYLLNTYPKLSAHPIESLVTENLTSPFSIHLKKKTLQQIRGFISESVAWKRQNYQSLKTTFESTFHLPAASNQSICMSYDFHIDPNQDPKLIEINTNASFLVLSAELYRFHNLAQPIFQDPWAEIKKDILSEIESLSISPEDLKIAIVDEDPVRQKLFIEFLVYQQLFESFGWQTQILDVEEPITANFVYNRSTDFLFETSRSAQLRSLYEKQKTCLSPHPFEYFCLADKQRLIDWSLQSAFKSAESVLPKCELLTKTSEERLWTERKKYFFKPVRSFGSKQSYRGSSISRRLFEELVGQNNILAQEYIPAPEIVRQTPEGESRFKYDLRVFCYGDKIESMVARIYQGQVTNLKTKYGGFAPVILVD
jgi:hypothetical protein